MELNVSYIAAKKLINEFTKSKFVVSWTDRVTRELKILNSTGINKEDETGIEPKGVNKTISETYYQSYLTINDQFKFKLGTLDSINPDYESYIESLKDNVISEIEENINIRFNKFDILRYLINLDSDLKEIRKNFNISENDRETIKTIQDLGDQTEKYMEQLSKNENIKVEFIYKIEEGKIDLETLNLDEFKYIEVEYYLCHYWEFQIEIIERLLRYIEPRKKVIEITDDYVKVINSFPSQPSLHWTKSDTDLLELIISLYESGAI